MPQSHRNMKWNLMITISFSLPQIISWNSWDNLSFFVKWNASHQCVILNVEHHPQAVAMEELRRKSSLNVPPNTPQSFNQPLKRHLSLTEAERTYIFTTNVSETQPNAPLSVRIGSGGHSRSVSHGGGAVAGPLRPSLKSAMKGGHQRALSQGQIQDAPKSGHSRVGSKTDFILPPSHKDEDGNRESSSAILSGRGHSRQASRSESIYTLRRQDLPPFWKRFLFCRSSKFEDHGFRIIVPNHTIAAKTPKHDHPNGKYVGNKIRTTKYTLLTFLPKNLLEQFHRVANLYFIFIQILNWIPKLNVFGKEIAMLPLMFVLGVTAIKDLFEDRRRFASDKRINNSTCRVYHGWVYQHLSFTKIVISRLIIDYRLLRRVSLCAMMEIPILWWAAWRVNYFEPVKH